MLQHVVYRMENEQGEGPYWSMRGSGHIQAIVGSAGQSNGRRPGPYSDGKLMTDDFEEDVSNILFGFSTLNQALDWFPPASLARLEHAGFKLVRRVAQRVWRGRTQATFRPASMHAEPVEKEEIKAYEDKWGAFGRWAEEDYRDGLLDPWLPHHPLGTDEPASRDGGLFGADPRLEGDQPAAGVNPVSGEALPDSYTKDWLPVPGLPSGFVRGNPATDVYDFATFLGLRAADLKV